MLSETVAIILAFNHVQGVMIHAPGVYFELEGGIQDKPESQVKCQGKYQPKVYQGSGFGAQRLSVLSKEECATNGTVTNRSLRNNKVMYRL